MTKNGPEFLIGWRDFPLERDDTWEPISNLTGSEHMICEFQKQHALDYEMKTAAVLKQVALIYVTRTHQYLHTTIYVTSTHQYLSLEHTNIERVDCRLTVPHTCQSLPTINQLLISTVY